MHLDIEAYQALKSEIIDNRVSVALLIKVVRAQEKEILRLRKLAEEGKQAPPPH